MFSNIDNEKKMAIILKTLLSKLDNGNNIKGVIEKTIDIDIYDNDDIYHKYIDTEISAVMFNQELVPYKQPVTELGFGSFGNVYKLKHSLDGEHYAIKRVPIIDSIDEIIREVKIMAKLSYHPNIVKYHHSWLDDKKYISYDDEEDTDIYLNIQLELCDYTLREYMCTHIYDDDAFTRVNMWKQLVSAIKHLHSHGVIHRDIKPSNIFIKNRILKLGDFGLSKAYDDEKSYSLQSTDIGCSYYRAPEIDSGNYTALIDVYSAGIILLELLLNYETMMEKDMLVKRMLKTGTIPVLLNESYKPLLLRTICPQNARFTIFDVDEWLTLNANH